MKRLAPITSSPRSGSILLMVLVSIIIMTLTTSSYLLLMRNEHLAAHHSGKHRQTDMLCESGMAYLSVLLGQTLVEIEQQGGLLDNPNLMQDVLVVDDAIESYRGRFSVVAPDLVQGYFQGLRFGLENESAKLNINSFVDADDSDAGAANANSSVLSPRERLMMLPGMDETVADAILDWLDADDSPRTNGAESSYYSSLPEPYLARNGPVSHLDELLMVQGVTPELLYGLDVNRNYQIDADELPRGALEVINNTNGEMNRGWAAYLTVHSLEGNVSPTGEPKIDLNGDQLQTLHSELQQVLGQAEANFIIVYRQFGPANGNANGETSSAGSLELNFEKQPQTTIDSVLDLIGVRVSVEGEEGEPAQVVESPWSDEAGTYRQSLPLLLDNATTSSEERIAGQIDINQASLPVLMTIPGMTEILADQIVSSRDPVIDVLNSEQRYPIWLIADALVSLEEFKPMFPYITTGGDVYRGQIVGYFDAGTHRSRMEVILDRSAAPTRLLSQRDLRSFGPGFSRSALSAVLQSEE